MIVSKQGPTCHFPKGPVVKNSPFIRTATVVADEKFCCICITDNYRSENDNLGNTLDNMVCNIILQAKNRPDWNQNS